MKSSFCCSLFVAVILASPVLSFAQVAGAESNTEQSQTGYGGTSAGGEQAGSKHPKLKSIRRNEPSDLSRECVGPVSYCNLYFGS
jgi:hypothetical protein